MSDPLLKAIAFAKEYSDGHLTICKFTTNWRAGFFTPGEMAEFDFLAVGDTMAEALEAALAYPRVERPSAHEVTEHLHRLAIAVNAR